MGIRNVNHSDIFRHRIVLADIGVTSLKERNELVEIFENTFGKPATYIIPDDIWDTEETE